MTTETTYKFFTVTPEPLKPRRETHDYAIVSRSGNRLGTIKWYSGWREYCLFPEPFSETVWSAGCLADLMDFMAKLKKEKINALHKICSRGPSGPAGRCR